MMHVGLLAQKPKSLFHKHPFEPMTIIRLSLFSPALSLSVRLVAFRMIVMALSIQ